MALVRVYCGLASTQPSGSAGGGTNAWLTVAVVDDSGRLLDVCDVTDDAAGYADRFRLTAEQREALIALDIRSIVAMGAHPLVPFLANMQVDRQRRG